MSKVFECPFKSGLVSIFNLKDMDIKVLSFRSGGANAALVEKYAQAMLEQALTVVWGKIHAYWDKGLGTLEIGDGDHRTKAALLLQAMSLVDDDGNVIAKGQEVFLDIVLHPTREALILRAATENLAHTGQAFKSDTEIKRAFLAAFKVAGKTMKIGLSASQYRAARKAFEDSKIPIPATWASLFGKSRAILYKWLSAENESDEKKAQREKLKTAKVEKRAADKAVASVKAVKGSSEKTVAAVKATAIKAAKAVEVAEDVLDPNASEKRRKGQKGQTGGRPESTPNLPSPTPEEVIASCPASENPIIAASDFVVAMIGPDPALDETTISDQCAWLRDYASALVVESETLAKRAIKAA